MSWSSLPDLSPEERARYARQTDLPGFGSEGQRRLKAARVLIVGAGGLGSPAAAHLAAAGVGRIGLVDFDVVEATNLHRQLLYTDFDRGRPKLEAAAERLRAMNPHLELELHETSLRPDNARQLVRGHDVVLDGSDNFPTRYAVNDACVLEGVPNVYGAVQRFEGQVGVLAHPEGPCYRCLFPDPPAPGTVPSCAEAGVLGVLPGTIGTLQATEAIKLLAGVGRPLVGRLLVYDALRPRLHEVRLTKSPRCPACGENAALEEVLPVPDVCPTPPHDEIASVIDAEELAERLEWGEPPLLLDVRTDEELALARIDAHTLHVPLHLLPLRVDELATDREYAVVCHTGVRSHQATQFLRQKGFSAARNLRGGIDHWSRAIDPDVPRY